MTCTKQGFQIIKCQETFIFRIITHFLNISYNSKKNMQSCTCKQNWPKKLKLGPKSKCAKKQQIEQAATHGPLPQ